MQKNYMNNAFLAVQKIYPKKWKKKKRYTDIVHFQYVHKIS